MSRDYGTMERKILRSIRKLIWFTASVLATASSLAAATATGAAPLTANVPWQGLIVFTGVYPTIGYINGTVTSLRNPGPFYYHFPDGQQPNNCQDPAHSQTLMAGQTMGADGLKRLYGSSTPALPIRFVLCAGPPGLDLSSAVLDVTYNYTPVTNSDDVPPPPPFVPAGTACLPLGTNLVDCRIGFPDVQHPLSFYNVPLLAGDNIRIEAGGCVQTGGWGHTWKHYVYPQGPDSGALYHGRIRIPGLPVAVDPHYDRTMRISDVLGKTFTVPTSHDPSEPLELGYEDGEDGGFDAGDYGDNGYNDRAFSWPYHGWDNGTNGQCVGEGPAWVIVHIERLAPSAEFNVDRPGYDYREISLSGPNFDLCRAACANDAGCRAYTYVNRSPQPLCYLKWQTPTPVANNCCISGLHDNLQYGEDHPGGDYRRFELMEPDVAACSAACMNDANCASFTYVNPGIQTNRSVCYLKSSVPAMHENSCCVSGVKSPSPWVALPPPRGQ